jgi:hypothetical protein
MKAEKELKRLETSEDDEGGQTPQPQKKMPPQPE